MDTSPAHPARPADLPLSSMGERGVKGEGVRAWPSSCCGPKTRPTVLASWVSVYRHTSRSAACTLGLTAHPRQPAPSRPLWLLDDVIRVAWLLRCRQHEATQRKTPFCQNSARDLRRSSLSVGGPNTVLGHERKGAEPSSSQPTPSPDNGGGAVIMITSNIPASSVEQPAALQLAGRAARRPCSSALLTHTLQ